MAIVSNMMVSMMKHLTSSDGAMTDEQARPADVGQDEYVAGGESGSPRTEACPFTTMMSVSFSML